MYQILFLCNIAKSQINYILVGGDIENIQNLRLQVFFFLPWNLLDRIMHEYYLQIKCLPLKLCDMRWIYFGTSW